jgi:hypothetical protein
MSAAAAVSVANDAATGSVPLHKEPILLSDAQSMNHFVKTNF